MKHFINLTAFVYIFLLSGKAAYTEAFKAKDIQQEQTDNIILGEDISEINAYVKNIYAKNGKTCVDIDLVQFKYRNTDERIVINKNPKIRTYILDKNSLIYTDDCKEAGPSDLIKIRDRILKNKSLLIVGQSKSGKMVSINFGCFG
ncbi:hypothetical protein NAT51_05125 [Flavobacterium amniphilum]|uniref:hypothetical protein n=1 Tax=Flavobacterium amniphilum TaxID=1834035 RepID=UPI00202A92DC|nr:hypothetical protein [Flavobacterium amniphilum]MCL9804890.1 hypothetical protein [Flavobacterium amniphilum]